MGQARDLAKRLLGDRIIALLEHKSGHPKFACGMAQIVELLLHRIADKDQRLHFKVLSLPLGAFVLRHGGRTQVAMPNAPARFRAYMPASENAWPGASGPKCRQPTDTRRRASTLLSRSSSPKAPTPLWEAPADPVINRDNRRRAE
jgi:hypothetical protein